MKKLILLIAIILFTEGTNAQYKIDENFDYNAGDSLGAHGWIANTGGPTNRLLVTAPGLTYSGYPLSGIGNATTLTQTGEDAYKNFATIVDSLSINSVYVSCMVKFTNAQRPGDYFLTLIPSYSTTLYSGRVYARLNSGVLEFGLVKASPLDTSTMQWATGYSLNTTYVLVLKYKIIPGLANNEVSLFVLTSGIPATEPTTPTLGPSTFTSLDAESIGRVLLRQGTTGRAPDVIVDGIRVSTSWFKTIVINLAIQGLFVPLGNQHSRTDTVSVYLRRVTSPYAIVDSFYSPIDSKTLIGTFEFRNASNFSYYIDVRYRHLPIFRNGISTWSKTGGFTFTQGTIMQYDFTTSSSQAYGNNLLLMGTKFTIYSGDINQDEIIDATDLSEVDNDAYNSVSGYVRTDLTGDDFVDAQDLSIVDNNAFNSVSVIRP
ncbi:MAG: hypothetical protein IPG78_09775 [Ignavibacteria bacterium]|nr:hypothetical protein [Ignavibacteria bacterium]